MQTVAGTGNTTITRTGSERQVAVRNLDASATMNVKVNEDTVGFTMIAGERNGWRITRGIFTVILTTTGSWETTFAS
jgi:hypothetical protein